MSTPTNEQFLEAMFIGALPGTYTIVCSFPGDPNTDDQEQARRNWYGRPWTPGQLLPRWFAEGNTYLTVSAFRPDPRTGKRRRRKANFAAMHAVMVDDVGTKVSHDKVLLEPSALIETSPANFQAYLFLVQDENARDRPLCELLVDRMVAAGLTVTGADPGMKGVTRCARLPVGINAKAKYVEKLGHAFTVRCTVFKPSLRYTIAEIANAWRLDLTAPPRPRAPVVLHPAHLARITRRFDALLKTFELLDMYRGRINGPWYAVRCPWTHTHTDGAESGTAIAEPSADNNWRGGFQCHHGHCADRTMADIWRWVRAVGIEAYRRIRMH